MSATDLARKLIDATPAERSETLAMHAGSDVEHVAAAIRLECVRAWASDPKRVQACARAIDALERQSPAPLVAANGEWVRGISAITRGKFERAVDHLRRAGELFVESDHASDAANSRVALLLALAMLGRYDEAIEAALSAIPILEKGGDELAAGKGRRVDNNQPVIVAVLDTGIDLSHPAFAGRLVPQADMYDFVSGDNDPSEVGQLRVNPSYGHGTHVAGIVALTVPDAKIMPLRILDENGEGELWRITAALIWAANHGADIANLSLGYPQSVQLLKQLIDCSAFGTTPTGTQFPLNSPGRMGITVSSGNGGTSLPIYPAAEDSHALAVAASTRQDRLALFSTYDRDWVGASAPGEDIVSALPGGRYGVWTGTSMAAPIAAGLGALVKARYPTTFPNGHELMDHVSETSVDIRYTASPWGEVRLHRVDALCAVTIFDPQECPIPQNISTTSGFEQFLIEQ